MDTAARRRIGLLIILCTVLAALVLAQVGHPTVAGRAEPQARPDPPTVGACVDLGPPLTVVGCQTRHAGEVTATWTTPAQPTAEHGYGSCLESAERYVGSGTDEVTIGWAAPRFLQTVRIVVGPGRRPLPGWSWAVCLIVPVVPGGGQGYLGSVAGLTVERTPTELRRCFTVVQLPGLRPSTSSAEPDQFTSGTSCRADHRGEVLGLRRVRMPGPTGGPAAPTPGDSQQFDTDPGRAAGCARLARTVLRVADPTFDHRLVLRIRLEAVGFFTVVPPSGEVITDIDYAASCTVEAPAGQLLDGTLVGIGTGPLPLR